MGYHIGCDTGRAGASNGAPPPELPIVPRSAPDSMEPILA
jgi:hypothetical protein